jgi:cobalt-zinc-cadmium efflux system outer membrane protein
MVIRLKEVAGLGSSIGSAFFALLAFLLAINVATASAAEKVFGLPEVLSHALENNGEIKALRAERGLREAGKIRAGLLPNPSLELEGAGDFLFANDGERRFSAAWSQEILTAGKRTRRLKVAGKDLEEFGYRIADAERLLAEGVKIAFYDLLLAEHRLNFAGRFVEINEHLLRVARDRFEAGDIPELEVNLARVEVARSRGRKAEAEREIEPRRSKLFSLMGLPPGSEVAVTGPLGKTEFSTRIEDLKALALARRPDLLALAVEKEKAEAEIRLAEAEGIPNVTASLSLEREESSLDVGGITAKDRDKLVGLKLSVPLPLFDRNQARKKESITRRESVENRYRSARKNVERDVEAAFSRLMSTGEFLSIYDKDIFPQLEENFQLTREAYRLGEVGFLSVVEEQRVFLEVNEGYLSALHEWNTSIARLSAAVGGEIE